MKFKIITIAFILISFSVRSQEKTIKTSDGVELYINVKGEGTPLLYIHGGPGSGSYWVEKFFGADLEKHYKVIYLDQRGVGRSSSAKNADYSLKRLTLDFEEVRKELGIDSWVTLGHSFGGILQMGYYENYPDAIKGMIMVNCTLDINESFCESWSPKAAEFLGLKDTPSCANDTIPLMDRMNYLISQLREKDLFWKMAYKDKSQEAIMNATYDNFPNWNYSYGSAAFSYKEYWKNFKPSTANVKIPVLFFYGVKDWMVGPEHYKGVKFPNVLVWANKGGHIPFQENKEDLEKAIANYQKKFNL